MDTGVFLGNIKMMCEILKTILCICRITEVEAKQCTMLHPSNYANGLCGICMDLGWKACISIHQFSYIAFTA